MQINDRDRIQIIHKEIDLIQNCINRMAKNSFLIKGWLISLIAILIGLKPSEVNIKYLILILALITISFWYLDGFFLKTEYIYRLKYDYVIEERKKQNFENLYDLNPNNIPEKYKHKVKNIFKQMISKTLRSFYGPIIIILIISYLFIYFKKY